MSAFTRELSDAGWYRGLKIPAAVLLNIDEKTKRAVSGTGGTWAPTSPLIIRGAGIELQCALQLTGATVNPAPGKAIRFGDDDYFIHGTPPSRVIDQSPLDLLSAGGISRHAKVNLDTTLAATPSLRTIRAGAFLHVPLRIPDGSILTSLAIDFKVGQTHASVPANLPKARVVRVTADGIITQYPYPTSAIYEKEGWVSPATPASGAAWYAAGALQTLTLTYDGELGAPTDSSIYGYAVEWKEESGTNAFTNYIGNHLLHFRFTITQPDLRPY